ncbi:chemotaxis protein CheW [Heliorestis convoluta]|uniref:chemotaxis protein CheW n=1 Tax=Heliorestis convoluta TaxID=356322 RepID=UPI001389ADC7|nr:chemotaxis protein CheW [Heliorestis convoluta]
MGTSKEKVYLIIVLKGQRYGVPAEQIKQIAPLPMISQAEEYPDTVAGLIDWHGQAMPLIDLSRTLGRGSHEYRLQDKVIVLEAGDTTVALVVNAVEDMYSFATEEIKAIPQVQHQSLLPPFVTSLVRHDQELIFLLSGDLLLLQSFESETRLNNKAWPPWTDEEKQELRQRAQVLAQPFDKESNRSGERVGVVVRLNGELFWFDLIYVQEFLTLSEIVPIPCTPEHVVGVTNLRGQIITVFDLRPFLGLPRKKSTRSKLVVIATKDFLGALQIDAIMDLVVLREEEILPAPVALRSLADEYARGHIPFREKFIATILDIDRIFQREELVVYEEI